jgi:hypothetical protein
MHGQEYYVTATRTAPSSPVALLYSTPIPPAAYEMLYFDLTLLPCPGVLTRIISDCLLTQFSNETDCVQVYIFNSATCFDTAEPSSWRTINVSGINKFIR